MDELKVPEAIRTLLQGHRLRANTIGRSGARVLMDGELVLKVQPSSPDAERETALLGWLDGKLPVPRLLAVCAEGGLSYTLMSRIPREISRYEDKLTPAIIAIPGVAGNTGAGIANVKKSVEQAVGSRHSVFPAQQIGTRLLALVDIRHQQFQLIRTCRYVETIALQLLTHRLVERTIVGLLDFRLCLDGLAPDIAVRATHRDRYRP